MGRVVRRAAFFVMFLGLAAGAARLGLGLPPIRLADYTTAEAVGLGLLAAGPILGVFFALLAIPPSAFARAGVGLQSTGGLEATGELQGAAVVASPVSMPLSNGKKRLRQGFSVHPKQGDADLPAAILSREKDAPEGAASMPEVRPPAGYPSDCRVWIAAGAADPYRGGQAPAWMDADLGRALGELPQIERIETGRSGVRVVCMPSKSAPTIREIVLLARRILGPPLDESKLDRLGSASVAYARGALAWGFFASGFLGIIGYGCTSPTNVGFEADVLAKVVACPIAVEALGDEPHRNMVGYQASSTSKKHSPIWRNVDILVEGAKRDGAVHVVASEVMREGRAVPGSWVFLRAALEVGNRTIDVLHCGDAIAGPVGERSFQGVVRTVDGSAPVAVGAACRILTSRGTNPYNCRLVVRCDDKALYGATPALGYAVCGQVMMGGKPAVVAADRVAGDRSEPRLDLDERRGSAIVDDGAWRIEIGLEAQ